MLNAPATTPGGSARDYALLLLLATLWGSSYTLTNVAVDTIPPVTLTALRLALAGALLSLILAARGLALPKLGRAWRPYVIQSLFNNLLPFTLIAWGQQTVSASLAVILSSTPPIFAFLLAAVFLRQEPSTVPRFLGVLVGIAGVAVIVGTEAVSGIGRDLAAQLAMIVAAMCYATAAIYGRSFATLDPMIPATATLLTGAALIIPVSMVVDRPWTLVPSVVSLVALVANAVFCTALALVIYFRLLGRLGSVGTTAQAYLRVPIGVGIGVVFLGDSLGPADLAGFAAVVVAVFLMNAPIRRH